jgi:hypothetical protein
MQQIDSGAVGSSRGKLPVVVSVGGWDGDNRVSSNPPCRTGGSRGRNRLVHATKQTGRGDVPG